MLWGSKRRLHFRNSKYNRHKTELHSYDLILAGILYCTNRLQLHPVMSGSFDR